MDKDSEKMVLLFMMMMLAIAVLALIINFTAINNKLNRLDKRLQECPQTSALALPDKLADNRAINRYLEAK